MFCLRKNRKPGECRKESFGNAKVLLQGMQKNYTLDPKTREYPEEIRQQAIKTYYAGASGRGVGKVFGFGKANVHNWIKKTPQNPKSNFQFLESDELYWFIGKKSKIETRENTYVITMVTLHAVLELFVQAYNDFGIAKMNYRKNRNSNSRELLFSVIGFL